MSDPATLTPDQIERLDFEGALKQLEGIVAALESGRLPLEQALDRYETGVRLVQRCRALLQAAEERLTRIEALHRETTQKEAAPAQPENGNDDFDDIPF